VTTFKTYHGAHQGTFLGAAPSGREIHFEALDAIRVHNGKITEHWVCESLPDAAAWRLAPKSSKSREEEAIHV
jgi:predicted ester cyclase